MIKTLHKIFDGTIFITYILNVFFALFLDYN